MACRLKICGVTRPEDVDACVELGVDAIGFNLWSGSPRGLTPGQAKALVQRVPAGGPARIGVVVDPDATELREWIADLALEAVQLHGARSIADYPGLAVPHVRVIRGTPALEGLVLEPTAQWILLDAAVAGYGGRGVTHDWAWAATARAALAPTPVWLAGGLDPSNAAAAIATVRPAGIDVASGAEDGQAGHWPGHKSRARIAALRSICDTVRP